MTASGPTPGLGGALYRALIGNPRLNLLLIALILVAGLGALNQLARTEDPAFINRFAALITPYPGASAEKVELLVTERLESALRQLDELKLISSSSRPGLSVITLELKDSITEVEPVWSRARDLAAEAAVVLPPGTGTPSLDDRIGYAFTRIFALRWRGNGDPDLAALGRYSEAWANQLRLLPGTDFVKVQGRLQEEILVSIEEAQLQVLGIAPQQLAAQIAASDSKTAAGTLDNDQVRAQVEIGGELDSLTRIRQIPLRLASEQQAVRLGDLAEVRRQPYRPAEDTALVQGESAVLVSVRMLPDTRIDRWDEQVEEQLEQFLTALPANVQLDTLFTQRRYTEARLGELSVNLAQGFVLILLVLMLTLGLRSALLVAAALPITALITLACMRVYGLPIHQMSVTGLVVALGIMVDNAIVVVDAIGQRRREGERPLAAVLHTIHHLWLPLLASTLTTVLAFAPIWMMPGPAGEFVGGIALSVSFALLASYLVSHTLIAGLAGRFIRAETGQHWWQGGLQLPWLATTFQRLLQSALARPKRTLLAMTLLPLLGFVAATQMAEQFFPPSDRDMFQIELWMPASVSQAASEQRTRELDRWLRQQPGITQTAWSVGRNIPAFYYNLQQRQQGLANYAQGMITTTDFKVANRLIPRLQSELTARYPDIQVLVRKLEQGPPFEAPIEIRLQGSELPVLDQLGETVRLRLQQHPDILHTRASLTAGLPKVQLQLDETAVRRAGLTLNGINAQLRDNLNGHLGGTILEGPESLPVRVRIGQGQRQGGSDLANLLIITPTGQWLPLSALGDSVVQSARTDIPRRNGERLNSIQAFVRTGVLPSTVLESVLAQMERDGFALPPGYRLSIGGESAERNNAVGKLLSSVALVMALLVSIVVLSFNSFRLTLVILASALQSTGLGLLCVYLAGYPFGFNVIIGLMGLMGLSINAAIVILAELEASPEAKQGVLAEITAAVARCGRHIGSTTITTIGGFLPLILAGGGFWPPFSIAIAGGTLLTTLLSFLFVPAAYRLVRAPGRQRVPLSVAA
ncbi:efflux RND transporter permease subunit [Ferrimonas gelatinilytica]|uniref:Efflux RND transporter permease subunit n=1 Tax=Ferrimonas gelatinilytica TaxID=1255257 RepID=A0ABP9S0A7_9GAMM